MLDTRSLVYLPRWVRVSALALLAGSALFGGGIAWIMASAEIAGRGEYGNAITLAIALAQTALSALAVVLLVVFSERDVNTEALQARTAQFLGVHLPAVLARVTPSYDRRATTTQVRLLGRNDIFGAGYELENHGDRLMLWVGLNVSRLIVIYWIAARDGMTQERAQELFQFTFGGAQQVGFDVFYESVRTPGGEPIVSIWATVMTSENLLTVPSERLFWMQDIAMMTESFWRTALRNDVPLARAEPSPL
jgi:hypothetical protein